VLNGAPRGSARSLRALEWLNAIVADVRAGVGPYLAIYLRARRHWDPEQIGLAMSAMDLASVLGQTPAGRFTDRARDKRLLVVAAAVGVAAGSLLVVHSQHVPPVIARGQHGDGHPCRPHRLIPRPRGHLLSRRRALDRDHRRRPHDSRTRDRPYGGPRRPGYGRAHARLQRARAPDGSPHRDLRTLCGPISLRECRDAAPARTSLVAGEGPSRLSTCRRASSPRSSSWCRWRHGPDAPARPTAGGGSS